MTKYHNQPLSLTEIKTRAAAIKLVIFDVDGVLTNGTLFYGDDGQEYKAFHSRDGHGMKMLQASGVDIGIITGRSSEVVKHRVQNLDIKHVYQGQIDKLPAFERLRHKLKLSPEKHVYQGQIDKLPAFERLRNKLKLSPEQIACVGDDVVDLPIMLRVGLAITVQDGHDMVKQHAHWITRLGGGQGAAREVCELIMDAQGTLESAILKYLS